MADTEEAVQIPLLAKKPAKVPIHNLGHSNRDLGEMRRELAEKLDRIIAKSLANFESGLDSIPAKFLAVPIGILIDKRLALDAGPAITSTQNNTVVINGFSRADALAFLSGAKAGNGFGTVQDARSISSAQDLHQASAVLDIAPAAQLSSKTPV